MVESGLNFRITGSSYRLVRGVARNLVEIEVESRYRGGEEIRIGGLGGASLRVEIQPLKQTRRIHLRHLRQDPKTGSWRSLRVRDLRVPREGMAVDVWGDLEVVEIQSKGRKIQMEVELEQRLEGQLRKVELGLLKAPHERLLRLYPRDWSRLDNEGIRPEMAKRP